MRLSTHIRHMQTRLRAETGQALVEYALILVLVSIVSFAVLTAIGGRPADVFSEIKSVLDSAF